MDLKDPARWVFVHTMTVLTLALLPYLIARPASRWMPSKQTPRDRKIYRRVIAAAAVVTTTAASVFNVPLLYALALLVAAYLTFYWAKFGMTERGKAQLASAKLWAEIRR